MATTNTKNRTLGKAIYAAFAVAAVAAALLVSQQPAQAHGSGIPYHQSGGASCGKQSNGNLYVWAKSPTQIYSWSGSFEKVRWSPDLYWWNGSSWVLADGTQPWFQAEASGDGIMSGLDNTEWQNLRTGAWHDVGNGPVFTNLPRGYYFAVKEYYYWPYSGRYHVQWSYFTNIGAEYCRLL